MLRECIYENDCCSHVKRLILKFSSCSNITGLLISLSQTNYRNKKENYIEILKLFPFCFSCYFSFFIFKVSKLKTKKYKFSERLQYNHFVFVFMEKEFCIHWCEHNFNFFFSFLFFIFICFVFTVNGYAYAGCVTFHSFFLQKKQTKNETFFSFHHFHICDYIIVAKWNALCLFNSRFLFLLLFFCSHICTSCA